MLRPSAPALVAAAIALGMDGVYVSILIAEGDNELGAVLPFVLLIAVAGLAAGIGSLLGDPRLRASLLWPAAFVLLAVGILAIFSIGLPLVVAGVLAAVGAVRATARLDGIGPVGSR